MNNLEKLYDTADKEKISVYDKSWSTVSARIFEIDHNYIIALNKSCFQNSMQERETLAEELGHYYCNALYYLNENKYQKSKCEYRAKKWAYSVLVPIPKLKEKISEGLNTIYDLAEYFEVEPSYMNECINFYNEVGELVLFAK